MPRWRAIVAVSSLLDFLARHVRRQERADAFFPDGGADHTECIARSAAMPGTTDFRIGLKVIEKLGSAAPEEVGPAGQIGQRGAAFEPVGGDPLAERRVVALFMGKPDPALDAREQVAKGRATALSEAFVAAVHPDSPGGQPAPGVDAGAPDHQ